MSDCRSTYHSAAHITSDEDLIFCKSTANWISSNVCGWKREQLYREGFCWQFMLQQNIESKYHVSREWKSCDLRITKWIPNIFPKPCDFEIDIGYIFVFLVHDERLKTRT